MRETTLQPTEIPFHAPPVEVTLLEDRAQVTRRGTVPVPPGRVRLVVDDVAPVLADKTLTATVAGAAGIQVVDVRVVRAPVRRFEDLPEDLAAVRERLRTLDARIAEVRDHLAVAEARQEEVRAVLQQVVEEASEDSGWGRGDLTPLADDLARLADLERTAIDDALAATHLLEDLEEERDDVAARRRPADRQTPRLRVKAHLFADLEVSTAQEVTLSFTYVVPGACWRPAHTARLLPDGSAAEWTMDGCVWQHTGETWTDVSLRFSTLRPSLGLEPPLLGEDVIRPRPRQETVTVSTREQRIQTTGLGGGGGGGAPELPGIDDGGEVRVIRGQHPATIPSDGRPYRVRIQQFRGRTTTRLVARPERTCAAILEARIQHEGASPLLAGPVDLFGESGRVGRTSVLFVAPGEVFPVGFGPDASIRMTRRIEQVDQKPGPLSRWHRTDHRVFLFLSNIGATPRRVRITERIPVSEVEQVRVVLDPNDTRPRAEVDADGMVTWDVDLPANGMQKITLAWTLERKPEVTGVG